MLSKRRLSAATRTIDNNIQKVLRKIEKNDSKVDELVLGDRLFSDTFNRYRIRFRSSGKDVTFNSSKGGDFSTLGRLIGKNTHLTKLSVAESVITALDVSSRDFYDGLKENSSINDLFFNCRDPLGEVAEKILKVYHLNSNQLHGLSMLGANLRNGGIHTLSITLQRCTNLKHIQLSHCNINNRILLPIVEAIRGHSSLETLYLNNNRIRRAGCTALSTLLQDPNCNINTLQLSHNRIDEEGITIIANSLANNTSLQKLYLHNNNPLPIPIHPEEPFCNVLCNTTSINSIHLSNHTLEYIRLYPELSRQIGPELRSLLKLNEIENKRQVAMRKILLYHPNIDMEPYFADWISDDERTLKGLSYVVAWFDRANEIFPKIKNKRELANLGIPKTDTETETERESYDIDPKKLSAIFQFTRAMQEEEAEEEVGG